MDHHLAEDRSPDHRRVARGNSQRWQARVESHRWGSTGTGPLGTLDYRLFFTDRQCRGEISPLHDIPCYHNRDSLNFVCKTPKGSKAEYEVSEDEHKTPLRRSARWDKPAYFAHDAVGNLGFIPQTFADPTESNDDYGGLPYDGQPVEFMEIGSKKRKTGHVYAVKPLCAFAVVNHDISNISWKLVGIAADDPLADELNDSSDIVRRLPGMLESVRQWFRICRCVDPQDKESVFGFNERPAEPNLCTPLISQVHEAWGSRREGTSAKSSADVPLRTPTSPISVLDVASKSSVMSRVHVLVLEPSNHLNRMERSESLPSGGGVGSSRLGDDAPLFTPNECLGSSPPSPDFNDGYGSDYSDGGRRRIGKGQKRVSWGWVETREIPARRLSPQASLRDRFTEMDRMLLANSSRKKTGSDPLRHEPLPAHSSDVELWHRKSWESMKEKYLLMNHSSTRPDSVSCHPHLLNSSRTSHTACCSH